MNGSRAGQTQKGAQILALSHVGRWEALNSTETENGTFSRRLCFRLKLERKELFSIPLSWVSFPKVSITQCPQTINDTEQDLGRVEACSLHVWLWKPRWTICLSHTHCPNKQQQPWASFIPKRLSVQTPFPSSSKRSALAQQSWCWICSFKNLNPGFPVCLSVPLWAWEGFLTQVLPLRHPNPTLTSVSAMSKLLPPFRTMGISGFLYHLSGTPLTSSAHFLCHQDPSPLPSHSPETVQITTNFMQKYVIPKGFSLNQI